jgi:hypothetical protein
VTESPLAAKQYALSFAFLRHVHQELPATMLQTLPPDWRQDRRHAQLDWAAFNLPVESRFDKGHDYGVVQAKEQDGLQMPPIWCAALPHQAPALARVLQVQPPLPPLTEPAKRYLLQMLYQRLGFEGVLPTACLPASPLNKLTEIDKRSLVRAIDYYGIFELAALLRRTVLPAIQQQARALLSPRQRVELDRALQSQDLLPPPALELESWLADSSQLNRLLQLQGLMRLAKALAGSDSSLVWHVAHHLDIGRGRLLLRHARQPVDPVLEKRLVNQLDSLLSRLER